VQAHGQGHVVHHEQQRHQQQEHQQHLNVYQNYAGDDYGSAQHAQHMLPPLQTQSHTAHPHAQAHTHTHTHTHGHTVNAHSHAANTAHSHGHGHAPSFNPRTRSRSSSFAPSASASSPYLTSGPNASTVPGAGESLSSPTYALGPSSSLSSPQYTHAHGHGSGRAGPQLPPPLLPVATTHSHGTPSSVFGAVHLPLLPLSLTLPHPQLQSQSQSHTHTQTPTTHSHPHSHPHSQPHPHHSHAPQGMYISSAGGGYDAQYTHGGGGDMQLLLPPMDSLGTPSGGYDDKTHLHQHQHQQYHVEPGQEQEQSHGVASMGAHGQQEQAWPQEFW
jgi:hypothetical protein